MSTREELNSYIERLERRLRLSLLLRGAAILTGTALLTTLVLVLIINLFAFSAGSIISARAVLFFAIVLVVSFFLAIPLSRLNRRTVVGKAENVFPQFNQSLVTFAERDRDGREPFIDLLAADTLKKARGAEPDIMVPDGRLFASAGAGIGSLGVLLWMILAGPGFLGYGASLLWAGSRVAATPFYDIQITPGDAIVRRNADQLVTAMPVGLQPDKVRLYARYQSSTKWEQVTMQPQSGASGFQFLFAGLPENVEYYVEAGAVHSKHYNIRVVDMPSVKQIRVIYHYPSWAGLQTVTDENGGDLRAVQGTDAELQIQMDRPMTNGLLVLDNDQHVTLSGGEGNVYKGTIHMEKDGIYHVAAVAPGGDQGQPVRLSGDYFIAADQPKPPEIAIARPSGDYRASPIEEVTVAVRANDDYGINALDLHYSVNGGPEQTISLLKQKGAKQADGSTVLSLENFKLVPGDVVSMYANARDARSDARTDITFVQAEPFEREFTESQQMGGGGGGGGGGGQQDPSDISQREKEIIAATWKQQGDKTSSQLQAAESSKFLSEVQLKLADQARSLSYRMQSRELSDANQEFNSFVADMNSAAQAMGPASEKLKGQKWSEAMPNEQKSLQYLLRAEATFRQIEVAFGARGGGGGGGAGAGRDLASLFDLELDTEKNQYETAQTAGSQSQKDQQIDDAMKKLDDLARRQQELADQRHDDATQSIQERWQQEMLKRDAEEMQREMQQLAQSQNNQNSQQSGQSSQPGQSGQSGQAGKSGQSGQSGQTGQSQESPAQQALDRLRQATDAMGGNSSQSSADARRAADRLKEATNLLGGMQQQQSSNRLDSMAREADQLASEEQSQADRMRKTFGQLLNEANSNSPLDDKNVQELRQLGQDRQKLSDDLSNLRKQMQGAERDLASNQRPAASKLRDALGGMEQGDLPNLVQRSADWLSRGVDPNSNSTESEIGKGLQQLSSQMHEAQQAVGSGQPQDSENALDRIQRLRDQIQALDPGNRNGQNGRSGQRSGQGQIGQAGQDGQPGQNSKNGQASGSANAANGQNSGQYGDARNGGGYRNGTAYGNIDTGNNSNLPRPGAPANPGTSISSMDPEVAIQQGVDELNQLRQTVQNDPEAAREVQDLIREMQGLDPRRFPGNPAIVEQLHAQVLSDVDKLELRLQRTQDDKQSGQIRSSDSDTMPSGYQDAVAEYFRRLSKRP